MDSAGHAADIGMFSKSRFVPSVSMVRTPPVFQKKYSIYNAGMKFSEPSLFPLGFPSINPPPNLKFESLFRGFTRGADMHLRGNYLIVRTLPINSVGVDIYNFVGYAIFLAKFVYCSATTLPGFIIINNHVSAVRYFGIQVL